MNRNLIVMGERSICGNFGRVMVAGQLNMEDSNVNKVHVAGNVNMNHSSTHYLRCAGDLHAENSKFGTIKTVGAINMTGICQGKIIAALGSFHTDLLECQIIRNGFRSKSNRMNNNREEAWSGTFKADTFENIELIHMNFDYEFKNIISSAALHSNKEITCDNFYSLGELRVEEINAENVFILTYEGLKLNQLSGGNIVISRIFKPNTLFHSIPKTLSYKKKQGHNVIIDAAVIEADHVNITNTKAELVSGQDVVIGDLCIIERVEYTNSIKISNKAVVNEVIKL